MSEYIYLERAIPKHIVKQIRADAIEEVLKYINSIYGTSIELSDGTYITNDNLLIKKMVINKLEQLKEQNNG